MYTSPVGVSDVGEGAAVAGKDRLESIIIAARKSDRYFFDVFNVTILSLKCYIIR